MFSDTVAYSVTARLGNCETTSILKVQQTLSECVCFPSISPLQLNISTRDSAPGGLLYLDTGRCGESAYAISPGEYIRSSTKKPYL